MAKIARVLKCDLNDLLHDIDSGIRESISASLEEMTDYDIPGGSVALRVYERYSYMGGNRVSLTVLAVKQGDTVNVCGISSGGSQGIFFKINTIGENSFLAKLEEVLDRYQQI
ncbi:MAG: hypothetical protein E7656_10610 [Ruminococcaceae bacterium]|nr:hypothetical protein [Oscillospiraceae bacterium]